MSFWTLLGYGWIVVCFTLGVFAMAHGFMRFLVWCSLAAALWGLHSIANRFAFDVPPNLIYAMHLGQGLSLLLLISVFGYTIKRSLKAD